MRCGVGSAVAKCGTEVHSESGCNQMGIRHATACESMLNESQGAKNPLIPSLTHQLLRN